MSDAPSGRRTDDRLRRQRRIAPIFTFRERPWSVSPQYLRPASCAKSVSDYNNDPYFYTHSLPVEPQQLLLKVDESAADALARL